MMRSSDLRERINAVFSELQFEEQRHLYFWEGEKVRASVSKLVELHAPKFDPSLQMLARCARKEDLSIDELKRKWQTTNVTACDLGHQVHTFLENFTGIETPKLPQEAAGINFLKDISVQYEIVSKEIRLYSREFKYAGTADLLLYDKFTGEVVIADYKTNQDLFKSYDFMFEPFSYLESSAFNKYQFQMSYYQIMFEEAGIKISNRLLVHLKVDGTYRIFPTVDFTKDLKIKLAA